MRDLVSIGFALAALALPVAANAQAQMCRIPERVERPRPELPSADQPSRVLPIGGYTLALTWAPGYCRAHGGEPDERFRCGGGNAFGFTLHGLWPDGVGKAWPQYCAATPILSPALIRKTLCSTPSAQLIQHEWAKHGTCTAWDATHYFDKATALYRGIRFPDMAALSRAPLTVGRFKERLAAVNRALPASAIRVTATRDGWLDELWLCLDTRLRYTACRAGTGGSPDAATLRIGRAER
jgi:ribonuclease T2